MVNNTLYLLVLILNKIGLVANDDHPHCFAGVVAHFIDPVFHFLEGLRTSDIVNCKHDPCVLVVDLSNGAISLLSCCIPYFKGDSLSIFELVLFFMIDSAKCGLNDVEIAILVDVSMDNTGLTDP